MFGTYRKVKFQGIHSDRKLYTMWKIKRNMKDSNSNVQIYDVPMKFAHKLIHGGPVHLCHSPLRLCDCGIVYLPDQHNSGTSEKS